MTAGRRSSIVAGLSFFAWLVPAFAFTAGQSNWDPVLLASLAAIAMASYFGAVALRVATALDGAFIAALMAVVLLGPVPAACIWVATEIAAFFVQRRRLDAFVANTASFSSATLAAAAVLAVLVGSLPMDDGLGLGGYLAVGLAGIAMLIENFVVGAVLIDVLRDRRRLVPVMRAELLGTAPATASMIGIGILTLFLYAQIGVLALALFALIVLVPQLMLPGLLRRKPVSELYHTQAVSLYAQAIGQQLGLPRNDRLVLKDAASFMRECPTRHLSNTTDAHLHALVEAVLYHGESWDGKGGDPGAVGGEMIPMLSRVLAVADAWAGLTAKGSPELGHYQALHQLQSRAGLHFDPSVVSAVRKVIEHDQLALDEHDAYQPNPRLAGVRRLARRAGAFLGEPLFA
jgi:HD domain